MPDFLSYIFESKIFMPHGHCYLWRPEVLWLHVISDALIALAYFSIPVALFYFVLKRKDLVFNWIFVLFGIFIMACGTTHVMSIWTVWIPLYRFDGYIKAVTAAASVGTAYLLWPLIPKALQIPSPEQLKRANADLEVQIEERKLAEKKLNLRLKKQEIVANLGQFALTRNDPVATFELAIKELSAVWQIEETAVRVFLTAQVYEDTDPEKSMLDETGLKTFLSGPISYGDDDSFFALSVKNIVMATVRRNRAETKLAQHATDLESANRELEAFTYTVSHDLRAPLRAISYFSRILREDYASNIPAEAERYLQRIQMNGEQMGQLIDDLLEFSRLGRKSLERRTVTMNDIVMSALHTVQSDQESSTVRIDVQPQMPDCPGDAALLKQVYINLLSNALKYTRTSSNPHIEIGSFRENEKNVYFVKDNGVGFDMQYVDKLFNVFQRLHRAAEFEGTGVGLAIVRRIVERHRGKVWADAKLNSGATFFFTIGDDDHVV